MHLIAQVASVPFGNAGDEIGGSSQGQSGREAADDRRDPAVQAKLCQGVVEGALVMVSAYDLDVCRGGITGRSDFAFAQRMSGPHDTDVPVSKQCLRPYFRAEGLIDHACFQIDGTVAERATVLLELVQEAQPNAGRVVGNASQQ